MNTRRRFAIAWGLFGILCGVTVLAAPQLPEQIVSHWNAAGEPDATMPKAIGLALIPGLLAAMLVIFAAIPRIDPLRENVAAFRPYYDWFVVVLTAFMAVIHGGIIAYNLGYAFDFILLVLVAMAGLFYYLGILLENAKRNWFVGIRTPWTLSSSEVWDRTNRLGGQLFKLTAVLALIGVFFGDLAIYFLIVPALLTAGITVAYSYVAYERLERGVRRN